MSKYAHWSAAFILFTSLSASASQADAYIEIYLYPWSDQLLIKETVGTIRKSAPVHIQIREKYAAKELLHVLHIDALHDEKNKVTEKPDLKIQLVIDVADQDGVLVFISDGSVLCTADENYCIPVAADFKRRFDPL